MSEIKCCDSPMNEPADRSVAEIEATIQHAKTFFEVTDLLNTNPRLDPAIRTALGRAYSVWLDIPFDHDRPSVLDTVDSDTALLPTWRAIFDASSHPVIRARLGDLLWTLKHGPRPDLVARAAIDAHLELAEIWEGLAAMDAVARSIDLSLGLSEVERATRGYAIARAGFEETLPNLQAPRVSIGYLKILAIASRQYRTADLPALIERAKATFVEPDLHDAILTIELRLARGDEPQTRAIQAARGRAMAQAAEAEPDPTRKYFRLQQALALAEHHPELRSELLKNVHGFDLSTLAMQRVEVGTSIDLWQVLELQRDLVKQGSAVAAFDRLVNSSPPSGDAADNLADAQASLDQSVMRHIATQFNIDPDVGQARPIESETTQLEKELARVERMRLGLDMDLRIRPVLMYLPIRFPLDPTELSTWLTREDISSETLTVVTRAIFAWWNGDDRLGVALSLINAIEALARRHLELIGGNVLDVATDAERGGVRSLSAVLADLKDRIDESWRRYLLNTLVAEFGLNLRNRLSHGITHSVSDNDVAVLVLAALYLARLSIRNQRLES
jgi:hypothetical protein